MSTSELYKKYFGDTYKVDLKHPNMEAFFDELAEECKREDEKKSIPKRLEGDIQMIDHEQESINTQTL